MSTIETLTLAAKAMPPELDAQWRELQARLALIAARHPDAVFATSLAPSDMLLTYAIAQSALPIQIFTLDTGRLHKETLALLDETRRRLSIDITVCRPEAHAVQEFTATHGLFPFYESVALRKACCNIRKVDPLKAMLKGRSAWLTGQTRDQSITRTQLPEQEHDTTFGLEKYNPVAAWSDDAIWTVIRALNIPYNALHDQGYPSIGCEPCTRAIKPGEDVRAGRWWWESSDSKECGLHEHNLNYVATSTSKSTSTKEVS